MANIYAIHVKVRYEKAIELNGEILANGKTSDIIITNSLLRKI